MTKEQIQQIKIAIIRRGLTVTKIAEELGTRRDIISQLVNGLYYYPRYAQEMKTRYGITIPDTRKPRRQKAIVA